MSAVSGLLGAVYVAETEETVTAAAATLGADDRTLTLTVPKLISTWSTITVKKGGTAHTDPYVIIPGGIVFVDEQTAGTYTLDFKSITCGQIGGVFDWGLEIKRKIQECTDFGDEWETNINGLGSWQATAKKYWFDTSGLTMIDSTYTYIFKFFTDTDNDECWIGYGRIDGNKTVSKVEKMVEEELSISGDGAIVFFDTAI